MSGTNAADPGARALSELRWLLLSPPLLSAAAGGGAGIQAFSPGERKAIEQWLDGLSQDTTPLLSQLEASRPAHGGALRLGRRAERLLEFFLRHGPTHRLVAANLPLRQATSPGDDRTTRGEIDFLLEDAQGTGWHWELAVKFFLCTARGPSAMTGQFVGPDRVEMLSAKLHKLFTRQLAHAAPPPHDRRTWKPAAYTRGWMFYRHGDPVPQCAELAAHHGRGWWIAREQAQDLPPGSYRLVLRAHWMEAAPPGDDLERNALLACIDRQWASPPPRGARRWPSAQMVWHVPSGERGFIVPPGWDQSA
ncbi:DUF1853 family protein [Methylibium rhizosphaerae]|uniref:DUF1853 family protein n=1 Tax=Methylibium rhizosphaerae TaxID=2570323 RepID=UPI0015E3017B|nr:DUF1853 family protein [Methylibium rhizosphaerae]